jgi:hypothetical protein
VIGADGVWQAILIQGAAKVAPGNFSSSNSCLEATARTCAARRNAGRR